MKPPLQVPPSMSLVSCFNRGCGITIRYHLSAVYVQCPLCRSVGRVPSPSHALHSSAKLPVTFTYGIPSTIRRVAASPSTASQCVPLPADGLSNVVSSRVVQCGRCGEGIIRGQSSVESGLTVCPACKCISKSMATLFRGGGAPLQKVQGGTSSGPSTRPSPLREINNTLVTPSPVHYLIRKNVYNLVSSRV